MIITTERCTIRLFKESDLDDFMHYRNNPEWMKYQIYKCQTRETYCEQLLQPFSLDKLNRVAITLSSNDRIIGDLLIKNVDSQIWIGYTIAPEYARQGYAYEATSAAIEHLFHSGVQEIYAGCERANFISKHLLEKLRFQFLYEDERGYNFVLKNPSGI